MYKISSTLLTCFLLSSVMTIAQQKNIYMDGDNYITLSQPLFPDKIQWTEISNDANSTTLGAGPAETYWFVHNGHTHILINLRNGKQNLFIELGQYKNTYHFPADYMIANPKPGQYNDFDLYIADKSGQVHELYPDKKTNLTLRVLQVDPSHLKIDFTGALTYKGNQGTSIPVTGKISLSKRNPALEHLPDSYAGCDNTIYNEMSIKYDLGQWYTATECEESFYKNVFNLLNTTLSPAFAWLSSQDWNMAQIPKYTPLLFRLRHRINDYFKRDPVSGIDYDLSVNANPLKGAYHDYLQKILEYAKLAGEGNKSKLQELQILGKEEGEKYKLRLEVFMNQPIQGNYPLDFSHAEIKKINDLVYEIKNVPCKTGCTYFDDGGVYLLIGHWNPPSFNTEYGHIDASPAFPMNGKKLSIQTMYIRFGCGTALAEELLKHINLDDLQKIITIVP